MTGWNGPGTLARHWQAGSCACTGSGFRVSSSAPTAVLIFGLLLPAPAVGQAADGGAAPAGTTAEVSLGDLEALVATIEDEAGRKRLVARIRALIAAQKSVTEEPAVESLGAGFIDRLSKNVKESSSQLAAAVQTL